MPLQSNQLISILLVRVAAAPSSLQSSQACSGLQINISGVSGGVWYLNLSSVLMGRKLIFIISQDKKQSSSSLQEKHPSLGNVLFEIPAIRFSCLLVI